MLRGLVADFVVAGAVLLAVSASAQAEEPFGLAPETFATELSTNQAGAHPDLRTQFRLNLDSAGSSAGGTLKDLQLALPRGLIASPAAASICPLSKATDPSNSCPVNQAVGAVTVAVSFHDNSSPLIQTALVYSVPPYPGEPIALAFGLVSFPIRLDTYMRSGGDYGITAVSTNITEGAVPIAVALTLWGVPADHNGPGPETDALGRSFGGPSGDPRVPFTTNPTECSDVPPRSSITLDSWQRPGAFTDPVESSLGPLTGCDQLEFAPAIEARPTTNLAGAPSGLDLDLSIPQNESADGFATPHLRDAVITLPAGMTVNPSAANGLEACSMDQVGISSTGQPNAAHVNCPNASRLGSVEALSPAIGHPLGGSLYLATQNDNPFGGLLALYLVVDDPLSGILVKLAGKVEPDPRTGQLTVAFRNNPQFPIADLHLRLFTGPRATLKTPSACGEHSTTSTLTPWTSPEGADAMPSSSFVLARGPSGGTCLATGASAPNGPTFTAGTVDPTAGAFSPLVLKLTRADGTQPIKAIDTTLPEGLLGMLAGTPYCSDAALAAAASRSGRAEQISPSCPTASRVGSVDIGAGAGSTPFHLAGKVHLAGPYKGSPLSLATVTPAVAGPLDLGTVVVRTALNVDPVTARIHAVSDPIPTILQGIPLDIRSIALNLDRPSFTLNPTGCDPAAVLGNATSAFDRSASLSDLFQVGNCTRLGFKPRLAVKLSGPTHRSSHPGLRVTLRVPRGDANVARAAVTLPRTELLEGSHIRGVCTRARFSAGTCPAASVYGHAAALSPLLDGALRGPVYLRANPAHRLPDLVASLDGQVHLDLVGRLDSPRGRIRASFDTPDVPLRRFALTLRGGDRGLVVNTGGLCGSEPPRAGGGFTAQSGEIRIGEIPVQTDCAGDHSGPR